MTNKKGLVLKIAFYTYCIILIVLVLVGNITRHRGEHELAALIYNINQVLLGGFFVIYGVQTYNKSKKVSYLCFANSILIAINYIF